MKISFPYDERIGIVRPPEAVEHHLLNDLVRGVPVTSRVGADSARTPGELPKYRASEWIGTQFA